MNRKSSVAALTLALLLVAPAATAQSDTGTSTVFFLSGSAIFVYASIIDGVSGDASFVTPSTEQLVNPSITTAAR